MLTSAQYRKAAINALNDAAEFRQLYVAQRFPHNRKGYIRAIRDARRLLMWAGIHPENAPMCPLGSAYLPY